LDIKPLFQVSLTILILSYLSVILSQTIILQTKFWTWRKHLVNPLDVIVDAVRKYAETDVQHGRASASYFPFLHLALAICRGDDLFEGPFCLYGPEILPVPVEVGNIASS
jgi:hypothetical protein